MKRHEEEAEMTEEMKPTLINALPPAELEDRGILLLQGSITVESVGSITRKLLDLHFNKDFTDPIQIIINSPGGEADAGWALIDLMDFVKNPIHTIAIGEIASMATYVFIAGNKRMMSPNSKAMIHQFTWGRIGTYSDLVAARKAEELEQEKTLEHLIRCSKYKNRKQIEEYLLLKNDNWLSPKEMLEHGLCDEIYKPRQNKLKKK